MHLLDGFIRVKLSRHMSSLKWIEIVTCLMFGIFKKKKKSHDDPLACINNQKGSPELGHGWRPSFYSRSLKWHHALWLSVISWRASEQWQRSSPLVPFPKISLKQHLQGTALESKSLARQQIELFGCRWLMASLLHLLCARTANPLHQPGKLFLKSLTPIKCSCWL